ncbi:MAG TPA: hypothetical protein VE980_04860 [Pyrinomonadaceae bacterium]|nr:hypothetical protein [Pyrinomonadaceae bacterium]
MKTIYSTVLALMFFLAVGANSQSRHIEVSGRAVDNNGAPIRDVLATLYSEPCKDCIDNVFPANRSFDEGFFIVDSSGKVGDRFTLYLSEIVPAGYWSPLGGPPFSDLAHLPEFRGIPLTLTRRRRIDLGEVRVRIRFGKVNFVIPESWKRLSPEPKALSLRLQDRKGVVIYDGELPATTATTKSDNLKLALTEGVWKVQLSFNHLNQRFISPMKSLTVQPGSCVTVPLDRVTKAEPCSN